MTELEKKEYVKHYVNILWSKLFLYRDYYENAEGLHIAIRDLSEEMIDCGMPKAISYDHEVRSTNPVDQSSLYNEILSKQQYLVNELNVARGHMKEIETIVNLIQNEEIRDIISYKFFQFRTWKETQEKYSRSRGSLEYAIRRELAKQINVLDYFK